MEAGTYKPDDWPLSLGVLGVSLGSENGNAARLSLSHVNETIYPWYLSRSSTSAFAPRSSLRFAALARSVQARLIARKIPGVGNMSCG